MTADDYRYVRVLLSEARARRVNGKHGFWFLIGIANSARRRIAAPVDQPMQADLFAYASGAPR